MVNFHNDKQIVARHAPLFSAKLPSIRFIKIMDGADEALAELHSYDAHEQDPVRNPNEIAWTRRIEWQHELDEAKYDLNVDMDYIGFREAILNANLNRVKASLSEGIVDPGILHNWAIRRACDAGALEIVELLLGIEGVDPAAVNSTAIVHAAQKGNESILAVLLTDGRSDPTVDDARPARNLLPLEQADAISVYSSDLLVADGWTPFSWYKLERRPPCLIRAIRCTPSEARVRFRLDPYIRPSEPFGSPPGRSKTISGGLFFFFFQLQSEGGYRKHGLVGPRDDVVTLW